ncbi:hypothetical protein GVAV_002613 [Gurleya vavrai]
MHFFYFFLCLHASEFSRVDKTKNLKKSEPENTKSIKDLESFILDSEKSENFLMLCKHYLKPDTLKDIIDIYKKYLTTESHSRFNNFVKNEMSISLKTEFFKKADDIVKTIDKKDKYVKKIYDNTKLGFDFLEEIRKYKEKGIVDKDLEIEKKISEFILEHYEMILFRIIAEIFSDYEKSNLPIYFDHITCQFKKIKEDLYFLINKLKRAVCQTKLYKNLFEKQMLIKLKYLKFEISRLSILNESQIIELKNDAFADLYLKIKLGLAHIINDETEYFKLFEDWVRENELSGLKYRSYISGFKKLFSNREFSNTLLNYLQIASYNLLKSFWDIAISSYDFFIEPSAILDDDFKELLKSLHVSIQKEYDIVDKICGPYEKLIHNLKENFGYEEKLTANTIQTFKNILIAESLIMHDDGRFYFKYMIEVLKKNQCPSLDYKKILEERKNILTIDFTRFNIYDRILVNSKSTEDEIKPIDILKFCFDEKGQKIRNRSEFILQDIQEIDFYKLSVVYNVCCYKHLLYKEISKPLGKKFQNYHLLCYVLKKHFIHGDYYNDIFIYKNEIVNFKDDLEEVFYGFSSRSSKKKLIQRVLIDFDEHYFMNNYIKDAEIMIDKILNKFLTEYNDLFLKCQEIFKKCPFDLNKKIDKLYFLVFFGYADMTNMKIEFDTIIKHYIEYLPNSDSKK